MPGQEKSGTTPFRSGTDPAADPFGVTDSGQAPVTIAVAVARHLNDPAQQRSVGARRRRQPGVHARSRETAFHLAVRHGDERGSRCRARFVVPPVRKAITLEATTHAAAIGHCKRDGESLGKALYGTVQPNLALIANTAT